MYTGLEGERGGSPAIRGDHVAASWRPEYVNREAERLGVRVVVVPGGEGPVAVALSVAGRRYVAISEAVVGTAAEHALILAALAAFERSDQS